MVRAQGSVGAVCPDPSDPLSELELEEQSPLASPDGDIDPPGQTNSHPGGPPLAEPEAPPPGSSRQPFEDLLNWAAELDAALSLNQPLDVSRAPAGVEPLKDLDEFSRSPVEDDTPVDIEGLPKFTPLEEAEPALVWPERSLDVPPPAESPVTAQGTELERLVQELENDWFVANPEPAEPVGGNGQAHTAVIVDEPTGEFTSAVPGAGVSQEGFWQDQPSSRRRISSRTAGIAALIATVAVAGVVLVALALRGDSGGGGTTAPASVSLELPVLPIGSSAQVETEWELSGKDGTEFASTSTFTNRTSAPIQVQLQEVIPKSLARSVDDITFVGLQPTVINEDPVVQYLVDVPANGEVTRTYEIEVAPEGTERARLARWAQDLNNSSFERTGTLATPTTTTTVGTLPPETEPPPSITARRTTTTRRTTPTEPPPTEPPPTEPPPTEPPPTEPPPTQPPPTTVPPTTAPPSTAAP